MISTTPPGVSADIIGRLVGRFLANYLPGKPQLDFQAIPGDASVKGTNYFYKQAKPDGLSILNNLDTMVDPNVLQMSVVKYKPLEFEMIGGFNRGGNVIVVRKDAHKRMYDRSAKPVIVAAASGLRNWHAMLVWGAEFLGWNLKWVTGYSPDTAVMFQALRGGEAELCATSNTFLLKPITEDGVADMVAQSGVISGDKYIPRDSYMDVPVFPELLKSKKLTPVEWQGYLSWAGSQQADRWFALPPGTPKEYVRLYRRAFEKVTKDPEFDKLVRKQSEKDIRPIYGEELTKIIRDLVHTPDEAMTYANRLRAKYGLPGWLP